MLEKPFFRYLVTPLTGVAVSAVVLVQLRPAGMMLFFIAVLVYAFQGLHKRFAATHWLLGLAVCASMLPIDISLRNCDGPPKFVPIIYGYPSDDALGNMPTNCQVEWRGDVIHPALPARWALVW